MKKTFTTICALLIFAAAAAQRPAPFELKLWPGGPPHSNGLAGPETRSADSRISNVSDPTLTVFLPDPAKNSGRTLLICPGGGYSLLVFEQEGTAFAEWFAENGIVGAVLKYRMPNRHPAIPLEDARQAMHILRENAGRWGADPAQTGVIGFSAGGHLATTLATQYDEGSRPDFVIAVYPAVSFDDRYLRRSSSGYRNLIGGDSASLQLRDRYSNEKHVTPRTPPTLLLFSDDDKTVNPTHGAAFYRALKAHGIPAAFHVYPSGGHGWAFRADFAYHQPMKETLLDWIEVNCARRPAQSEETF